jgi:hypothetical protein
MTIDQKTQRFVEPQDNIFAKYADTSFSGEAARETSLSIWSTHAGRKAHAPAHLRTACCMLKGQNRGARRKDEDQTAPPTRRDAVAVAQAHQKHASKVEE